MSSGIFDRNGWKHYDFWLNGKRYRGACLTRNRRTAEQIVAAKKTEIAMGKVGLLKQPLAPTLEAFKERFLGHIKAQKPDKKRTYEFYEDMYQALLRYKPLAKARLDQIDEDLIDRYQQYALKTKDPKVARPVLSATINRRIAALRRAMYLAYMWKLINRVPTFAMLGGERKRTFIVTPAVQQAYLDAAVEPLKTIEIFGNENGFRLEELVSLTWPQVHLEGGNGKTFGYVEILRGKSKKARRTFPITATMKEILLKQRELSQSEYVFVRKDRKTSLSKFSLDGQQRRLHKKLGLPWDATIHSFRHTVATKLGLAGTDAFTMQDLMGWSNITIAEQYVHPTPDSKLRAIERFQEFDEQLKARELGKQPVPTKITTTES